MRIALLGDVALIGMFDCTQTQEVFERVEGVKQLVSDCDYVICNLETPLTNKKNTFICKGAYLRSAPENVEVLKRIGVTHVTLANNHIFDYGKQGAQDTISVLEKNHIGYCGLCDDPLLLTDGKDRVLIDGFCCYSANGIYYGDRPLSTQLLSYDSLKRFLNRATTENCLPLARRFSTPTWLPTYRVVLTSSPSPKANRRASTCLPHVTRGRVTRYHSSKAVASRQPMASPTSTTDW